MPQPSTNKNNKDLLGYAGLATQFLVIIGAALFAGMKVDKWLQCCFPLASWILPLLAIAVMLYKIYKDTSAKK